jgi:hypothetical protein
MNPTRRVLFYLSLRVAPHTKARVKEGPSFKMMILKRRTTNYS